MRTRAVIALLFFTLSGWAQAFAWLDLHGVQSPPTANAMASGSHAHSHSCCPKLHGSSLLPTVLPALPASLPCGDRHSCCFSRDSNNPPTLTATPRVERPGSRIAAFDGIDTRASHGFALARTYGAANLQASSTHSTVLRI